MFAYTLVYIKVEHIIYLIKFNGYWNLSVSGIKIIALRSA